MMLLLQIAAALALTTTTPQSVTAVGPAASARAPAHAVVLIVSDGMRWQDVFRGADSSLLAHRTGAAWRLGALRRDLWSP